ncbi:MAG: COP23 domain-containing protein [Cyanobacteria bacterium J06649_11]
MRNRLRLVITSLLFSCSALCINPASAQQSKYFCTLVDQEPVTMGRTIYGDVPIIRWTSGLALSGQSPQQRCDTTANRFQRAFDSDNLLLRAGELNPEQPVICAVSEVGNACSQENTVVFLNSDTDPNTALAALLNIRWISSLTPLHQGSDRLLFSQAGFSYSDLIELEEALICISEFSTDLEC